jgi:hypothetical protein
MTDRGAPIHIVKNGNQIDIAELKVAELKTELKKIAFQPLATRKIFMTSFEK